MQDKNQATRQGRPAKSPHVHHERDCDCGCGGACSCNDVARELNNFFHGKVMTARSFKDEQKYFVDRHRLHNRTVHGWGIVCGLEVKEHPRDDCKKDWVVVHPGIALDCCGREIILDKQTAFQLPKQGDKDADPYTSPVLLGICYVEQKIEYVPALFDDGNCDPDRMQADRIREGYKLEVLREVPPGCWARPGGDADCPCLDNEDESAGHTGSCLDCDCACGELVPLALLSFAPGERIKIDCDGRKQLGVAEKYLTHICQTNWEHGREVSLSQLRNEMGGRLTVRFDRKLRPADGDATGINPFTFQVQYGNSQRALEFMPSETDVYLDPDDPCLAVFEIDRRLLRGRDTIAGSNVHVTLECDFILDIHGNPVDGEHLRGRLKSGDGKLGGTFKTWFRVGPERESYSDTSYPNTEQQSDAEAM